MGGERHTIASLDVLRGMAILCVVVGHFTPVATVMQFSLVVGLSILGVVLFFFLSGFLMDLTFARDDRLGPYLIRRTFRIAPMYWVSILAILVSQAGWSVKDVLANATFTAPIFGIARMSGVYWTLYIEVLFYALVPTLFFLGPRIVILSPFAIAGVYLLAKVAHVSLSPAPFFLVFCLLGMQFGLWRRQQSGGDVLLLSIVTATAAASSVANFSPWLGLAPAICAPMLYAATRFNLRQRILQIFGYVSYSWYLLHAIIAHAVIDAAISHGLNIWPASLLGVAVAFIAAVATYLLVEKPFVGAGRALISSRHFQRGKRAAAEATS
jgi:peptidoglycan/LPS O-acetylase OafA/YrhL